MVLRTNDSRRECFALEKQAYGSLDPEGEWLRKVAGKGCYSRINTMDCQTEVIGDAFSPETETLEWMPNVLEKPLEVSFC